MPPVSWPPLAGDNGGEEGGCRALASRVESRTGCVWPAWLPSARSSLVVQQDWIWMSECHLHFVQEKPLASSPCRLLSTALPLGVALCSASGSGLVSLSIESKPTPDDGCASPSAGWLAQSRDSCAVRRASSRKISARVSPGRRLVVPEAAHRKASQTPPPHPVGTRDPPHLKPRASVTSTGILRGGGRKEGQTVPPVRGLHAS